MGVPAALVAGLVAHDFIVLQPQGIFNADGVGVNLPGAPPGPPGMPLTIQALVEEQHRSVLEITEQPVEAGAAITDHSFLRPLELTLRCGWSNSSLAGLQQATPLALVAGSSGVVSDYVTSVYAQLFNLQQLRITFTIQTTLRIYTDMIIHDLIITRDQKTAQALLVTAECRQIIFASTQNVSLVQANMANPAGSAPTQSYGAVFPQAVTIPTQPGVP